MRSASSRASAVISAGFAIGLVHCSSSGSSPKFAPPIHHFPSAAACALPSASGDTGKCDGDGGAGGASCKCTSDADCGNAPRGRCIYIGDPVGSICRYDLCDTASDCTSGTTCACADPTTVGINVCVPFNCQVDSECGANGFCSPSQPEGQAGTGCGSSPEYGGVYCHTAKDDCFNDSDCTSPQVCVFSGEAGKWTCVPPAICSG